MMRIQKFVLTLLCILGSLQPAIAQEEKSASRPVSSPSTAQGMEGGVWRTDNNFESTLELKNVLVNQALMATPIIYMSDGTPYELKPVALQPAGVATVNIGTALADLPAYLEPHRSSFGMVGVKFSWSWPAAVLGMVRSVDETAMVSFQSSLHADLNDVHAQTPAQAVQRIEGMWWKPYATTNGFIVLSNTLLRANPVTIAVYDSSGKAAGQRTVTLASHASQWLSLSDLVSSPITAGSIGSIQIQYQGPVNSISAFGGLEDDSNGYSATLHLDELHPDRVRDLSEHEVVLDGAGLMLGKQPPRMQFPADASFSLYSVLHNTSSQAKQVALSLTFAGLSGPETHGIGQVTLAPRETKQIDYPDLLAASELSLPDGSVDLTVSYMGHDGDVEVEMGSVDQTGNYVFQVISEPEEWTISRTLCRWSVLGDTNTMISLWNYSPIAEDLVLTLYYTGGKYLIPVHLEPRSDYEMDIATLIHSGQPDSLGTVIPQTITEGSANLADAQRERNKIFVALNAGVFNVRTATCGNQCQTCNGVQSLAITPNSINVDAGSTQQLFGLETMNTGSTSEVMSGAWSSTSGSASVNSNGLLTGTSVGTTTINLTESNLPAPAGYVCTGPNGGCPPTISASASASATTNAPTASISMKFTGSKSSGDNLSFANNSAECTESLGPVACPAAMAWHWNLEEKATVSNDASKWVVHRSVTSGRAKGYYKDSTGALQPFDDDLTLPNDDPVSGFVQQPSGQKTIYVIDGPGHTYKRLGYAIDSLTQVQNFSSNVCSTIVTSDCVSITYYVKLVVTTGAVLSTANSMAGLGSISTNF